ncbi:MAG: glucose 1-dehydrogenase [Rubricoccaceae bacterium]|nr:glucose 1-dehydrogenase [Rubricoccaceae bacterium]
MTLRDRVTLVTGAGSGIGQAIARRYAEAGAAVWVTDRDDASGEATAAAIRDAGGDAVFHILDVTDEAACEAAARAVHDRHGRLDVLVNNAGVGHVGTLLETTGTDFDRMYAVNVRGVFNATRAFLPGMLARRSGVVLNLASIGGITGIKDRVAYCATKFAVVGMTKCLALDHAAEGLRAVAICPARVETPFVKQRLAEYPDPEAAYREMSATQPVGRMARPEEIAAAALYLASDEASFVTGVPFYIDGGWTAGT